MKRLKTNDELIKELLTLDEHTELQNFIEKEVTKHRGGARKGAGRKPKAVDKVLSFQIRVSLEEKNFLKYAREHNLDYKRLMES